MKYQVTMPFSYKFNGGRKEVKVGDSVSDKEIKPEVLKYLLEAGKVKPTLKKKVKKISVKKNESKGKKKLKRSSKKEVSKKDLTKEETKALTGVVDFNKESLLKKSTSELRRIAVQVGVGMSGTKEMIVNRILKSGING